MRYEDAGVDVSRSDAIKDQVMREIRSTWGPGAAPLGGETAEMPDTYLPDVIDVAGCMLGTVSQGALLDGARVRAGDVVLGLAGSGLHTNGYSLARRVLAESGLALEDRLPGGAG